MNKKEGGLKFGKLEAANYLKQTVGLRGGCRQKGGFSKGRAMYLKDNSSACHLIGTETYKQVNSES